MPPTQQAILIATIGTRDLIFQTSDGEWLNLGDDRSYQQIIALDLGLPTEEYGKQYRKLTALLLKDEQKYQNRILPVMLGGLLGNQSNKISKIILVGTDQAESVPQRNRDTLHACELIHHWIATHYPDLPVEIVTIGQAKENPSNFDSMFQWWSQFYREKVHLKPSELLWLSLKGGVGQMAEAGRVAALNSFGDQIRTIDYQEQAKLNRQGQFSTVLEPSKGRFYLWDLTRRQAIALLDRFDYSGIEQVLSPYWRSNYDDNLIKIKQLVDAAIDWNMGNFQLFAEKLPYIAEVRSHEWWWVAYETAYQSIVRLEQGNTVEALFHSFRAIEGLISSWAEWRYPEEVDPNDGSPFIKTSILEILPSYLDNKRQEEMRSTLTERGKLNLYGFALFDLLRKSRTDWRNNQYINIIWDHATPRRNRLFHRLLGLQRQEVFEVWKANTKSDWEECILGSLNFIACQSFPSLADASLIKSVNLTLKQMISQCDI